MSKKSLKFLPKFNISIAETVEYYKETCRIDGICKVQLRSRVNRETPNPGLAHSSKGFEISAIFLCECDNEL